MKIGLALSGGGFRATGFHLGVLTRLAVEERLEDVTFVSSVSGGSLCVGLVYAVNNFKWPTSKEYLNHVLPRARTLLTTHDLQRGLILQALRSLGNLLDTRADDMSELMRKHWGLTASLGELPEHPRWMINATCYETGKNWRFERFRMGDYLFGYSYDTQRIPVSDAVAASAGFPGLIGPLVLDARPHAWFRYTDGSAVVKELEDPESHRHRKTEPVSPLFPKVHLWDGGVYDNHGLEGLHDFITGWRDDVEFFIVSDASGGSKPENYQRGHKALLRIISGIMMDQVRSLRARAIIERFLNHEDAGAFLHIGNSCRYVFETAKQPERVAELCHRYMSEEDAVLAAAMKTHVERLSPDALNRLIRHGYEVADYTFVAYHPEVFKPVVYPG